MDADVSPSKPIERRSHPAAPPTVDRARDGAAFEFDELVTVAAMRIEGWTPALISRFLGEPDKFQRRSRSKRLAPYRLYWLSRIQQALNLPDFQMAWDQAQKRIESANKAVATKRRTLLQQVASMKIDVTILPLTSVQNAGINAYNKRHPKEPISAPIELYVLDRITVNYIRHQLTKYDDHLEAVAGRVGNRAAVNAIRAKVYGAIALAYPVIAYECRRQCKRRLLGQS